VLLDEALALVVAVGVLTRGDIGFEMEAVETFVVMGETSGMVEGGLADEGGNWDAAGEATSEGAVLVVDALEAGALPSSFFTVTTLAPVGLVGRAAALASAALALASSRTADRSAL
jgi:hypothetical protein